MYVCVCRAVTEREIKASIDGGATTVAAVTRACRAGGDCGACRGEIEELLEAGGHGGCGVRAVGRPPVRERAA